MSARLESHVTVRNVHERSFAASRAEVGALIDDLGSHTDRLWPRDRWPRIRFEGAMGPGVDGGHGPIRYTVEEYQPGEFVRFRFTRPAGFDGYHAFAVRDAPDGRTLLRHELAMRARGVARLSWPLVFRPLHDALLEDALDRASAALGEPVAPRVWPTSVRVLRWFLRPRPRPLLLPLAVLLILLSCGSCAQAPQPPEAWTLQVTTPGPFRSRLPAAGTREAAGVSLQHSSVCPTPQSPLGRATLRVCPDP